MYKQVILGTSEVGSLMDTFNIGRIAPLNKDYYLEKLASYMLLLITAFV